MKNLSEQVNEEFARHQALVSDDVAVDYDVLDNFEHHVREESVLNEVVPTDVLEYDANVNEICLIHKLRAVYSW